MIIDRESSNSVDKEEENIEEIRETKNIAVLGMDEEGYRSDVMFVVNVDFTNNKVTIISVQRDTHVIWTEEYRNIASDEVGISQ